MTLFSCLLGQIIIGLLLMSSYALIMEKLKRGKRVYRIDSCNLRGVVVHFRPSSILPDIEAVLGVSYKESDRFSQHRAFPMIIKKQSCPDGINTIKESTNFDFACTQIGIENIGVVKDAKPRFYENLVYRLVYKREDCHNVNLYIPYQGERPSKGSVTSRSCSESAVYVVEIITVRLAGVLSLSITAFKR